MVKKKRKLRQLFDLEKEYKPIVIKISDLKKRGERRKAKAR